MTMHTVLLRRQYNLIDTFHFDEYALEVVDEDLMDNIVGKAQLQICLRDQKQIGGMAAVLMELEPADYDVIMVLRGDYQEHMPYVVALSDGDKLGML